MDVHPYFRNVERVMSFFNINNISLDATSEVTTYWKSATPEILSLCPKIKMKKKIKTLKGFERKLQKQLSGKGE